MVADPASSHPRFLVVKLADLGDALTATPAIRALRLTYPAATIDLLVTPVGAAVLTGLDSLDRLITFDKASFDRLGPALRPIVRALALGRRLRQARYDRVFLLHHLFTRAGRLKYAALLGATGSPWRAGVAEDRPAFLTHVLPDDGYGVRHEADYWLGVVGLAGATNPSPRFEVAISTADRARAAALLGTAPERRARPRIALYPGSGPYSPARRWPMDRYVAVGRRLVKETGAEILVIGSASERALAGQVQSGIGSTCRNLAGKTDVKTLAAVLSQSELLIGNDGGVMHLAAAVGIPIVAIFGPSNHISWGPYGGDTWRPDSHGRSVVMRTDLPCAPCLYRGFLPGTRHGCPGRDCLTLIDVGTVVQAALDRLRSRELPSNCS